MPRAAEGCHLYLVLEASSGAPQRLATALAAVEPETLLIVPPAGTALEAGAVKPLVEAAQWKGIATLLLDDPRLARVTRADGVHLSWSPDLLARYEEAREILGGRGLVGIDGGGSRHDTMSLGEAGADYVAFSAAQGALDDTCLDLVGWWSEIFEVPCVAFEARDPREAAALAEAGADFVAVRVPIATTGDELQHQLKSMAGALDGADATD